MTPEALPGKSVVLYQCFAFCTGKWATPTWMMGVDLAPHPVKALHVIWKAPKIA